MFLWSGNSVDAFYALAGGVMRRAGPNGCADEECENALLPFTGRIVALLGNSCAGLGLAFMRRAPLTGSWHRSLAGRRARRVHDYLTCDVDPK
jgi:hypothetical protein